MNIRTCNLGDRAKSAKASLLVTNTAVDEEDFDEEEVAVVVIRGRGPDVVSSLYTCVYM